MTDDNDRKLLLAILEQYVTPRILEDGYKFSDSGNYKCPENSSTMGVTTA